MRAIRCQNGAPTLVDAPVPFGEGVAVRVASAGICGSDLHLMDWNLPAICGHEFAGRLEDGSAVVAEPIAPCGVCDPCRSGAYNRCDLGPDMVMGVGRDGAMAETCMVPASAVVRLPTSVALPDACLVEPMAVAVHALRRGRVGPDDRVAVVGGGSIGQLAVAACRAGGSEVDMEARHPHQHEAAANLGAGVVHGHYDTVLEAAGTASALSRAVELCRPGGRIVLLGTYWGPVEMPGQAIALKELDLVPASMYGRVGPSRDFEVAAAILAGHPEVAPVVITHRFPLDAVGEAFKVAADRRSGAIKVVLEP